MAKRTTRSKKKKADETLEQMVDAYLVAYFQTRRDNGDEADPSHLKAAMERIGLKKTPDAERTSKVADELAEASPDMFAGFQSEWTSGDSNDD